MSNNPFHPFIVTNEDGYQIVAEIESEELFSLYNPLFIKHGYSGNGYCWEGHITQILEKEQPDLQNHMEFDPEAGLFFADVDTADNLYAIASLLSAIFTDLPKLEEYIETADRHLIDD